MRTKLLTFLALILLAVPASAQFLGNPQNITVIDSGTACTTAPAACATFTTSTAASIGFDISGTWTGTLTFEQTSNGSTWRTLLVTNAATGAQVSSTTAGGSWTVPNNFIGVRLRATGAVTGLAVVTATRGYGPAGGSSGGGGGGAATIADGADVAEGSTTDAAVGDATGTVNAHLREIAKKVDAGVVVTCAACATATLQGVVDADDASIANGQTAAVSLALNMAYDGSVWRRLTFGTAGTASAQVLTVQGVASMTPLLVTATGSGNFTVVQPTGTNLHAVLDTTSTTAVTQATGTNLHAVLDTTSTTAVTQATAANLNATAVLAAGTAQIGSVTNWGGGTLKSGLTAAMTSTTSTSVVAGTGSNYTYITSCRISNTHASVTTMINLQDGSGGATIDEIVAPFGGGAVITYSTPLKVPTIGNGLFAVNATTGSNTFVSCNGFISTVSY